MLLVLIQFSSLLGPTLQKLSPCLVFAQEFTNLSALKEEKLILIYVSLDVQKKNWIMKEDVNQRKIAFAL